jgi:hypothetical protein
MPNGSVKLQNDAEWHQMSYHHESDTVIYIESPPEMINYVYGATIEVRLESGPVIAGFGGPQGRISIGE